MSDERVNEIEDKIARGELSAAQVFTQMRQLIPAVRAQQSGEGWEAVAKPVGHLNVEHFRGDQNMQNVDYEHGDRILSEGRHALYTHPPKAHGVPEGWSAARASNTAKAIGTEAKGFLIQSPRVNGVAANTSVWEDSENPAERLLYLMLAATPQPEGDRFNFDGLRAALCRIGVVSEKDGHDLVRRSSVLEIVERFRPKPPVEQEGKSDE